jgi:PTS system mannose-specific IIC component
LILAAYAYISQIAALGPGWSFGESLVAGLFTGFVVGDVQTGLQVGATLTLMSLGMGTYGGATIPDFMTGAILGTAFGALTGQGLAGGLAIAVPAALLMTQLDVFGRASTTVFIHAADRYIEKQDEKGFTRMHILGQLPWGLTRAIPVFLAIWLGSGPVQSFINWMPQWFMKGIRVAGAVLPALGFALLLTMLPAKRYWPFLVFGYVLFAYMKLPVLGIALVGAAAAAIYMALQGGESNG